MTTIHALAESVGILLDKEPTADGKIHYIKTIDDKPGKSSGRYVLRPHENNMLFTWFMNHKTGQQIKQWIKDNAFVDQVVDPVEQAQADALDDERKQKTIISKWVDSSLNELTNHNYLNTKQIQKHCARVDKLGRLVIPVMDVLTLDLNGLQYISPNGTKKFETGTKQKGNGIIVCNKLAIKPALYITEGFATGASIAESICNAVICALSCGNLIHVIKKIKSKYSDTPIIICADNDQFTKGNPGIHHAIQAANEIGCKFIYPEFKEEHLIQKPTDFNDFARLYGKEALRRFINERIQ